jgi:pimeloyl-ACP methyl ester carboxylesterase
MFSVSRKRLAVNLPHDGLETKPVDHVLTRTGRKLEFREYGDPHGHPAFFFHGLIGSHHQASYIADQAKQTGLRVIAPNRPGVGMSEFIRRTSPLDVLADVEDLAQALDLDDFSVIGISGGAPYALAVLHGLPNRVRTATIISGMGPMWLRGALEGMERRRRIFLELGARFPRLALRAFQKAAMRFQKNPERLLDRLIRTWSEADQKLFTRKGIYDLFMRDLHQVFTDGNGAIGLSHELSMYRYMGLSIADLARDTRITLWHGLDDIIVPPAMTWNLVRSFPNSEAHFVAGGHFMAIEWSPAIITRLRQQLDEPASLAAHGESGRK